MNTLPLLLVNCFYVPASYPYMVFSIHVFHPCYLHIIFSILSILSWYFSSMLFSVNIFITSMLSHSIFLFSNCNKDNRNQLLYSEMLTSIYSMSNVKFCWYLILCLISRRHLSLLRCTFRFRCRICKNTT